MESLSPWTNKWVEIKPLSGGGQGDTLLVKSISGEVERAVLKLLKPQKTKDTKARGRMAQEVINLKVLRNAGGKVPQVLDSNTDKFEDQTVPLYFVMEYIPGKTLADKVRASEGLSLEASIGIALDLCTTMSVAIKAGIVHRDIKPENIIVRSTEPTDVVIVDFGLSFNEDEDHDYTSADESLDNKFVSLPERRGPGENKRDPRSDLTGICVILFYCLTGCSPRNLLDSQGRAPHQWPNYSLKGKVQNESQLSALDMLLSRGLNYEIELRFQTVDELIVRLGEVLTSAVKVTPEDLDTVLAREVAALRKYDRKTQLSEYSANAQVLAASIELRFSEITKRLANQKNFSIARHGSMHQITGKYKDGDAIAGFYFCVNVQNHSITIQIHYTFVAQGPECTVYRDIREGPVNQPTNTVDAPTVIMRYQGDATPTAFSIVADMDVALAKAIALAGQKIRSGS